MNIRFTTHAKEKFTILKRHGIVISSEKVIETLINPENIDYSRLPLLIAQSELDRTRVLRVVYKRARESIVVITFYPGRKTQYEKR